MDSSRDCCHGYILTAKSISFANLESRSQHICGKRDAMAEIKVIIYTNSFVPLIHFCIICSSSSEIGLGKAENDVTEALFL